LPQKAHLLIVDDEANTLASLSRAFRLAGHEATIADNAIKGLELAKSHAFDLIFSDVVMPGKDGLYLLEELKHQGVTAPVVMMSGQAHIDMAVKATRLGALDFLEKPISTDKLLLTVENALKLQRLELENRQLRSRLGKHEIVWAGEAMRRVMAQIERVAASETRVCILGETGTGKELVARTLSPPNLSSPNSSDTKKVLSPELPGGTWGNSNKLKVEPSSWMKSGTCPWLCKPNSCGF
jgi:DNA-binding NtrC family response regulator